MIFNRVPGDCSVATNLDAGHGLTGFYTQMELIAACHGPDVPVSCHVPIVGLHPELDRFYGQFRKNPAAHHGH
jgi:hypothetical protein